MPKKARVLPGLLVAALMFAAGITPQNVLSNLGEWDNRVLAGLVLLTVLYYGCYLGIWLAHRKQTEQKSGPGLAAVQGLTDIAREGMSQALESAEKVRKAEQDKMEIAAALVIARGHAANLSGHITELIASNKELGKLAGDILGDFKDLEKMRQQAEVRFMAATKTVFNMHRSLLEEGIAADDRATKAQEYGEQFYHAVAFYLYGPRTPPGMLDEGAAERFRAIQSLDTLKLPSGSNTATPSPTKSDA